MSESAEGYKLTESDKQLIRGMGKASNSSPWFEGNIAALHFDGQMLVNMIFYRRELVEKLRVLPPSR